MAMADADVSGVTDKLAKTSLDQRIELSGKGQELNSSEDGNNIGEGVDDCIKSPEDANLRYDYDDDEDVEEDKGGQESKDPHLQVKGTAISPRREETKYMTPATAADFLAKPTVDKLLALGPERAEKVIQEIRNKRYMFEKGGLLNEFATISSLMYSENNDVKDAVYQISDAILKRLFSSEEFAPGFLLACHLLSVMDIFWGVDKLRSASGMLLTLEHAVNQQYFNEGTAQTRMMAFLSSINSSTPTKTYYKLCTLNARSIRLNKFSRVCTLVRENDVDLAAITETRLNDDDVISTAGTGLRFVHRPRSKAARLLARCKATRDRGGPGGRGGGTALLYKDTIDVDRQLEGSENKSFEFDCYRISIGLFQLKLVNIYRPPQLSTRLFLPVFKEFLKEHLLGDIPVIITGDFNIHVNSDTHESKKFNKLLNSPLIPCTCTQHVDFATQNVGGNTLDLVISRNSDNIIVGRPWPVLLPVPPLPLNPLSDHCPVMCLLRAPTGIL